MPANNRQRNRRSIRLCNYDYTRAGAYFITVVTHNRGCLFGEIVDGAIHLNDHGFIVQEAWKDLPRHYANVTMDAFVVMPNHSHGIIVMSDDAIVGAGLKSAPTGDAWCIPDGIVHRHGLPEIVRAFKTFSARRINTLRGMGGLSVWQRNYWEHIVRNEDEMRRIRIYITHNPSRWQKDRENLNRMSSDD